MLRRLTLLLIALAVSLAGLVGVGVSPAQAADRDCSDFANQRDAQIFFLNNGGPEADPHGLDAEGDGIACESNPCPCYYGKTPPGDGGGSQPPKPKPEPLKRNAAKVIKVVDGDTVTVRILPKGPRVRVRLLGIDSPKVHGSIECGGREASRSMKKMLPRGSRVELLSDRTQKLKDRHGRWLRYLTKTRGKSDIGRRQIAKGHAQVYVYSKPFVRVKNYRSDQRAAKRKNRGIWGNC